MNPIVKPCTVRLDSGEVVDYYNPLHGCYIYYAREPLHSTYTHQNQYACTETCTSTEDTPDFSVENADSYAQSLDIVTGDIDTPDISVKYSDDCATISTSVNTTVHELPDTPSASSKSSNVTFSRLTDSQVSSSSLDTTAEENENLITASDIPVNLCVNVVSPTTHDFTVTSCGPAKSDESVTSLTEELMCHGSQVLSLSLDTDIEENEELTFSSEIPVDVCLGSPTIHELTDASCVTPVPFTSLTDESKCPLSLSLDTDTEESEELISTSDIPLIVCLGSPTLHELTDTSCVTPVPFMSLTDESKCPLSVSLDTDTEECEELISKSDIPVNVCVNVGSPTIHELTDTSCDIVKTVPIMSATSECQVPQLLASNLNTLMIHEAPEQYSASDPNYFLKSFSQYGGPKILPNLNSAVIIDSAPSNPSVNKIDSKSVVESSKSESSQILPTSSNFNTDITKALESFLVNSIVKLPSKYQDYQIVSTNLEPIKENKSLISTENSSKVDVNNVSKVLKDSGTIKDTSITNCDDYVPLHASAVESSRSQILFSQSKTNNDSQFFGSHCVTSINNDESSFHITKSHSINDGRNRPTNEKSVLIYCCSECNKKFQHKMKLKTHLKLKHIDMSCSSCDKIYTGTKSLNTHAQMCHSSQTDKSQITSCPKVVSPINNIVENLAKYHTTICFQNSTIATYIRNLPSSKNGNITSTENQHDNTDITPQTSFNEAKNQVELTQKVPITDSPILKLRGVHKFSKLQAVQKLPKLRPVTPLPKQPVSLRRVGRCKKTKTTSFQVSVGSQIGLVPTPKPEDPSKFQIILPPTKIKEIKKPEPTFEEVKTDDLYSRLAKLCARAGTQIQRVKNSHIVADVKKKTDSLQRTQRFKVPQRQQAIAICKPLPAKSEKLPPPILNLKLVKKGTGLKKLETSKVEILSSENPRMSVEPRTTQTDEDFFSQLAENVILGSSKTLEETVRQKKKWSHDLRIFESILELKDVEDQVLNIPDHLHRIFDDSCDSETPKVVVEPILDLVPLRDDSREQDTETTGIEESLFQDINYGQQLNLFDESQLEIEICTEQMEMDIPDSKTVEETKLEDDNESEYPCDIISLNSLIDEGQVFMFTEDNLQQLAQDGIDILIYDQELENSEINLNEESPSDPLLETYNESSPRLTNTKHTRPKLKNKILNASKQEIAENSLNNEKDECVTPNEAPHCQRSKKILSKNGPCQDVVNPQVTDSQNDNMTAPITEACSNTQLESCKGENPSQVVENIQSVGEIDNFDISTLEPELMHIDLDFLEEHLSPNKCANSSETPKRGQPRKSLTETEMSGDVVELQVTAKQNNMTAPTTETRSNTSQLESSKGENPSQVLENIQSESEIDNIEISIRELELLHSDHDFVKEHPSSYKSEVPSETRKRGQPRKNLTETVMSGDVVELQVTDSQNNNMTAQTTETCSNTLQLESCIGENPSRVLENIQSESEIDNIEISTRESEVLHGDHDFVEEHPSSDKCKVPTETSERGRPRKSLTETVMSGDVAEQQVTTSQNNNMTAPITETCSNTSKLESCKVEEPSQVLENIQSESEIDNIEISTRESEVLHGDHDFAEERPSSNKSEVPSETSKRGRPRKNLTGTEMNGDVVELQVTASQNNNMTAPITETCSNTSQLESCKGENPSQVLENIQSESEIDNFEVPTLEPELMHINHDFLEQHPSPNKCANSPEIRKRGRPRKNLTETVMSGDEVEQQVTTSQNNNMTAPTTETCSNTSMLESCTGENPSQVLENIQSESEIDNIEISTRESEVLHSDHDFIEEHPSSNKSEVPSETRKRGRPRKNLTENVIGEDIVEQLATHSQNNNMTAPITEACSNTQLESCQGEIPSQVLGNIQSVDEIDNFDISTLEPELMHGNHDFLEEHPSPNKYANSPETRKRGRPRKNLTETVMSGDVAEPQVTDGQNDNMTAPRTETCSNTQLESCKDETPSQVLENIPSESEIVNFEISTRESELLHSDHDFVEEHHSPNKCANSSETRKRGRPRKNLTETVLSGDVVELQVTASQSNDGNAPTTETCSNTSQLESCKGETPLENIQSVGETDNSEISTRESELTHYDHDFVEERFSNKCKVPSETRKRGRPRKNLTETVIGEDVVELQVIASQNNNMTAPITETCSNTQLESCKGEKPSQVLENIQSESEIDNFKIPNREPELIHINHDFLKENAPTNKCANSPENRKRGRPRKSLTETVMSGDVAEPQVTARRNVNMTAPITETCSNTQLENCKDETPSQVLENIQSESEIDNIGISTRESEVLHGDHDLVEEHPSSNKCKVTSETRKRGRPRKNLTETVLSGDLVELQVTASQSNDGNAPTTETCSSTSQLESCKDKKTSQVAENIQSESEIDNSEISTQELELLHGDHDFAEEHPSSNKSEVPSETRKRGRPRKNLTETVMSGDVAEPQVTSRQNVNMTAPTTETCSNTQLENCKDETLSQVLKNIQSESEIDNSEISTRESELLHGDHDFVEEHPSSNKCKVTSETRKRGRPRKNLTQTVMSGDEVDLQVTASQNNNMSAPTTEMCSNTQLESCKRENSSQVLENIQSESKIDNTRESELLHSDHDFVEDRSPNKCKVTSETRKRGRPKKNLTGTEMSGDVVELNATASQNNNVTAPITETCSNTPWLEGCKGEIPSQELENIQSKSEIDNIEISTRKLELLHSDHDFIKENPSSNKCKVPSKTRKRGRPRKNLTETLMSADIVEQGATDSQNDNMTAPITEACSNIQLESCKGETPCQVLENIQSIGEIDHFEIPTLEPELMHIDHDFLEEHPSPKKCANSPETRKRGRPRKNLTETVMSGDLAEPQATASQNINMTAPLTETCFNTQLENCKDETPSQVLENIQSESEIDNIEISTQESEVLHSDHNFVEEHTSSNKSEVPSETRKRGRPRKNLTKTVIGEDIVEQQATHSQNDNMTAPITEACSNTQLENCKGETPSQVLGNIQSGGDIDNFEISTLEPELMHIDHDFLEEHPSPNKCANSPETRKRGRPRKSLTETVLSVNVLEPQVTASQNNNMTAPIAETYSSTSLLKSFKGETPSQVIKNIQSESEIDNFEISTREPELMHINHDFLEEHPSPNKCANSSKTRKRGRPRKNLTETEMSEDIVELQVTASQNDNMTASITETCSNTPQLKSFKGQTPSQVLENIQSQSEIDSFEISTLESELLHGDHDFLEEHTSAKICEVPSKARKRGRPKKSVCEAVRSESTEKSDNSPRKSKTFSLTPRKSTSTLIEKGIFSSKLSKKGKMSSKPQLKCKETDNLPRDSSEVMSSIDKTQSLRIQTCDRTTDQIDVCILTPKLSKTWKVSTRDRGRSPKRKLNKTEEVTNVDSNVTRDIQEGRTLSQILQTSDSEEDILTPKSSKKKMSDISKRGPKRRAKRIESYSSDELDLSDVECLKTQSLKSQRDDENKSNPEKTPLSLRSKKQCKTITDSPVRTALPRKCKELDASTSNTDLQDEVSLEENVRTSTTQCSFQLQFQNFLLKKQGDIKISEEGSCSENEQSVPSSHRLENSTFEGNQEVVSNKSKPTLPSIPPKLKKLRSFDNLLEEMFLINSPSKQPDTRCESSNSSPSSSYVLQDSGSKFPNAPTNIENSKPEKTTATKVGSETSQDCRKTKNTESSKSGSNFQTFKCSSTNQSTSKDDARKVKLMKRQAQSKLSLKKSKKTADPKVLFSDTSSDTVVQTLRFEDQKTPGEQISNIPSVSNVSSLKKRPLSFKNIDQQGQKDSNTSPHDLSQQKCHSKKSLPAPEPEPISSLPLLSQTDDSQLAPDSQLFNLFHENSTGSSKVDTVRMSEADSVCSVTSQSSNIPMKHQQNPRVQTDAEPSTLRSCLASLSYAATSPKQSNTTLSKHGSLRKCKTFSALKTKQSKTVKTAKNQRCSRANASVKKAKKNCIDAAKQCASSSPNMLYSKSTNQTLQFPSVKHNSKQHIPREKNIHPLLISSHTVKRLSPNLATTSKHSKLHSNSVKKLKVNEEKTRSRAQINSVSESNDNKNSSSPNPNLVDCETRVTDSLSKPNSETSRNNKDVVGGSSKCSETYTLGGTQNIEVQSCRVLLNTKEVWSYLRQNKELRVSQPSLQQPLTSKVGAAGEARTSTITGISDSIPT